MKTSTPFFAKRLAFVAFVLFTFSVNKLSAQVTPLSVLSANGTTAYTGSGTFAGTFTPAITGGTNNGCVAYNLASPITAAAIGRAGGMTLTLTPSAANSNVAWGFDINSFYYNYNGSTTSFNLKKISQSGRLDCAGYDDATGWGPETNMNQGVIYLRGTTSLTFFNTSNVSTTKNAVPVRMIISFTNSGGAPIPVKRNGDVIYVPMSQVVKVNFTAQVDASYINSQAGMWLANCVTHTGWQPALTIFDDLATTTNNLATVGYISSWYDASTNYTVLTSTPAGVSVGQTPADYTGPFYPTVAKNTGIEIAGRPGGITYTITNGNNASGTTANCYGFGFDPVYGFGYSLNNSANTTQGFYAALDMTNSSVATETDYTDLSIGKIVLYGASNITFSYATNSVATVRLKYLVQFKDGTGTNVPVEWRNGKIFRKLPNNGSSVTQINIQVFAYVNDLYKNTSGTATTPFWSGGGYSSTSGWQPALNVFDYLATTAANLAITSVTFEYYTLPIPDNTITVTESPVVGSPTDAVICSGGSVGLAVPNVVGNTYSWSPGGANTYNVSGITSSNTYSVTIAEGTFGCRATNTQAVVVNPTPAITAMTASTCGSFSVTPVNGTNGTVPVGTTYSWSAPSVTGGITGGASGSGASSISGSLTNPTNTAQIATYTVTPTAGACSGGTFTVTVTVNPTPAITGMSANACSGAAFSATPVNVTNGVVPSGTTYSWTAPSVTGGITGGAAGSGSSITGTLNNPTNTAQTATYTVTPTAGSCPGTSFSLVVTVNPKPAITNMTASTCSGVGFTATPVNSTNGVVPAGTTYSWAAPTVTGGMTGGAAGSGASNISGSLTNPTNTAQTATYTVTPTSGTCSGSTFTVTVTVNPTPAITGMSANACSGAAFSATPVNVTNGVVPSGTTYSWTAPSVTGGITGGAAGSGSSITGTLNNPTNTAQTATYTVTPTAGSCTGTSFTLTVTVNPKAAVTPMTASTCSGVGFTATPVNGTNGVVPAGTTYSWAAPTVTGGMTGGAAGSGSSITGTLTNATTSAQTATYSVTPTSGGCTGSAFTLTATINPLPTPTITPTTAVCSGSTGNVYTTQAGMTSYNWTVTGGTVTAGGTSTSNTVTVTWGASGTGHVKVNYVNGNGCTATAQADQPITINALPTPTVTPTTSVCANSTGNVYTTQSGMSNYSWSVTGGSITAGGGTGNNTATISWTTTNPGHVFINYTDANGCTASTPTDQPITVTVTPAPTGSTSQTFCAINSPTVANLVATGTAIQWYAGPTGGSPYATSTPLVDGNHYYATQTVGGCESPTRLDVKVGVDNPPAPTGSTTQNFCAINNPVVANLSATGASIQWYTVSTGGTPLSTSTALSSGHYYASQTVAGCQSVNRLDVTVTVGNPAAPTGAATQSFCANNSTTVGDLAATGTSVQWYSTSTGGSPLSGSDPLVSGNHYYASQTVGGCESAMRLDVTVTINPEPTPSVTPATAACEFSTGNVYTTQSGGSNYSWSVTGGTITSGGGTADNTATIDWGAAGTGHIVINYTDANGCTATTATDQSITIDQAVTANADVSSLASSGPNASQIEVCGSLSTSLVANTPSLGTGTWSQVAGSGTSSYSPNANASSVTATISGYSAPGTVTYRWTVVNGGCSAYSDVVVVYDPPIAVSTVLAGCSFVPLPPFSNDSIMILVQATGGSGTLSFSYPPTDELRINVGLGTKVYTAPTDGNSHSFSVSDAFCAQSSAQTTPATHITDIPFTATTGKDSATCYDKNFNKWVTFRDNNNDALLSINDNDQNLGKITVTAYRDPVAQTVNNANTNVCPGVQSVAMKRHFVITSTVAPSSPVTVRLYFTPTELNDLISESHANDVSGNTCTQLDNISSLSELYVTKYTGNLEDGDYSNNDAGGLYRVFGNTTSLPTQPDGPLSKSANGFPSLFTSGTPHHYVEFTVTEFSEIWMHGSQNATPLPVEMIYFEANAIDNSYIQLKWGTELEINNHGFQVERSLDGQNWGTIGWVDGHNNSTVQQNYSYNDYNVQPGVRYYYRLKQVDNDGMYEYTSIVSAIITGQVTFNVKDFVPNPTNQNTSLIVTASTEQEVTVNIYNAIGQVVTSNNYHLNKGGNQLNFDLSQLAVGTYTAVLSSANDIYSRKLVIAR